MSTLREHIERAARSVKPIQQEITWIAEWGATRGQIEHHEIELGLRDIDQPTGDPSWWKLHGSCDRCAA